MNRLGFLDVIANIADNNGSEGVDFSSCDLSGIDMGYSAVDAQRKSEGLSHAAWYSSSIHGIDLRGARFQNSVFNDAILRGADFREATLYGAQMDKADCHDAKFSGSYLNGVIAREADFSYCEMQGCYLNGANLSQANLRNTQLQGADLSGTNLSQANLSGARLVEVDMKNANLVGANLYGTWFSGTYLTRQQIGERIIQELPTWSDPDALTPGNHAQAASIYRALKSNFLSIGSYQDASWAYVNERRNRRKSHWPPHHTRANYPDDVKRLLTQGIFAWARRLAFYEHHLRDYLLDSVNEWTSMYGEEPRITLAWSVAIVAFFAVVFQISGQIGGAETLLDHLNYSMGSFVTVGFAQFEPLTPSAQFWTSFEGLLGICVLALLMFALGNKINRS